MKKDKLNEKNSDEKKIPLENVKSGGTAAQDLQSEANEGACPPLPPTTCSPLLVLCSRLLCGGKSGRGKWLIKWLSEGTAVVKCLGVSSLVTCDNHADNISAIP